MLEKFPALLKTRFFLYGVRVCVDNQVCRGCKPACAKCVRACVPTMCRSLFANPVAVTLRHHRRRHRSCYWRQNGLPLTLPSLLFTADAIFANLTFIQHEPAALINKSYELNPIALKFIAFSDTSDRQSCSPTHLFIYLIL
jgi:hypothetical protein